VDKPPHTIQSTLLQTNDIRQAFARGPIANLGSVSTITGAEALAASLVKSQPDAINLK